MISYKTPELSWVLDLANDFKHGFSEYTAGKEIKYPSLADAKKL